MKRLVLSMMVMMTMTMAFAENEETAAVNKMEAYVLNVNMDKLSQALGLSWDQREFVEDAENAFSAELMNVASAPADERKTLLDKAIKQNLGTMHYLLNRDQYHMYLRLLNTTINNRGLNK